MKTKNKILHKALELFNEDGLKDVTLRRIASSIGISQGNLNYHFKTKADIVSTLYYQLVSEMDNEMIAITQEQPVMAFLYESSLKSMQIFYKYRFILQDLFHVLETNKELKTHYLELQKFRSHQFLQLFQNLIVKGLMREEEFEWEYTRLYERMNILGDNWINALVFFNNAKLLKVEYYHSLLFEVLYPYLTEKGKDQYLKL